jgi:pyruvate formate lyase activating enzyme
MQRATGLIYDIKHFAVHDGPGVRTTIFLKGCPLGCLWCHSPESQEAKPQIAFNPNRCIGCDSCVESCQEGALPAPGNIDVGKCTLCGSCVEECYSNALEMVGKYVNIGYVLDAVTRDRAVIKRSGGGVTISGGEPLSQPDFTLRLLTSLKEEGYHTALDTCGQAPVAVVDSMLPYVDLLLYDVKHMNPEKHRELTGVSNDAILSNLRHVARRRKPIHIRMPLIPGVNDSEENLADTCMFIKGLERVDTIELLPYHRLGVSKYRAINKEFTLRQLLPHEPEKLIKIRDFFAEKGLNVILEGL